MMLMRAGFRSRQLSQTLRILERAATDSSATEDKNECLEEVRDVGPLKKVAVDLLSR
jgi:hypothetical protein